MTAIVTKQNPLLLQHMEISCNKGLVRLELSLTARLIRIRPELLPNQKHFQPNQEQSEFLLPLRAR
jgi:hypothetical protein